MPELMTIGETMVCLSPLDSGKLRYQTLFQKSIAGAESNVAIAVARLGHSSAWAGRVGNDEFGAYVLSSLRGEGVDVTLAEQDEEFPTGVMFKEFSPGGETSVFYYRKNSAASQASAVFAQKLSFSGCKILHMTGITPALSENCRSMTHTVMGAAKAAGVTVSFDPNLRLKLWSAQDAAKEIDTLLPMVDLFLPGIAECDLLFGKKSVEEHLSYLLSRGVSVCAIKLGAAGAYIAKGGHRYQIPPYPVKTIADPIGAGDAFAAGMLSGILEGNSMEECGKMAAAMGARALLSKGDYQSLPDRAELRAMMSQTTETIYR